MSTNVTKAALLKKRTATASNVKDLEVEGIGTITIRGLSRAEALELSEGERNAQDLEVRLLAAGMVTPALTIPEAAQWQKNAPSGEVDKVSTAIAELSGMEVTAAKDVVKEFHRGSRR